MKEIPTPTGKLVVVFGGGGVARGFARRLVTEWKVVLVEMDAEKASRLAESLGAEVTVLSGDATSPLVQKRSGVERAAAVVVALKDEEAIEAACRAARSILPRGHILALIGDETPEAPYHELGVDLVRRGEAAAVSLAARLTPGRVAAYNIGLGQGELTEVTLTPSSPIVGRPLYESAGLGWRIAALYRGEEFIVPAGDTMPESGDRVIVVAPPEQMGGIAEFISVGAAEFPLRFGSRIGVVLDSSPASVWPEALAITLASPCRKMIVFTEKVDEEVERIVDEAQERGIRLKLIPCPDPFRMAVEHVRQFELGLLAVPPPPPPSQLARFALAPLPYADLIARCEAPLPYADLIARCEAPLLIARNGGLPSRVLAVTGQDRAAEAGAEAALDIGRTLLLPLAALTVTPPPFIGGDAALEAAEKTRRRLETLSGIYQVRIDHETCEGNPVREALRRSRSGDLVVFSRSRKARHSFFHPDAAVLAAHSLRVSALLFSHSIGA